MNMPPVNCPARNRPPQNIPDSNTPPSHSHSNSAAPRLIVFGPNFLFMWSSPASRIKISSAFCVERSPSDRFRRLSLLCRGEFTPRVGRSSSGKYPYKKGGICLRETPFLSNVILVQAQARSIARYCQILVQISPSPQFHLPRQTPLRFS